MVRSHIGYHMASYGYIVMSHQNYTMPGIETCSLTTLGHTDAIIDKQGSIGGGVLNGHIDTHHIVWIGHSRGAEGRGPRVRPHHGTARRRTIRRTTRPMTSC